jgi:hypothetical protein
VTLKPSALLQDYGLFRLRRLIEGMPSGRRLGAEACAKVRLRPYEDFCSSGMCG